MLLPVRIVVTAQQRGRVNIVPYNHVEGCQLYANGEPVIYNVPAYKVKVIGETAMYSFMAIRFGLRNTTQLPPPPSRPCDVGLSAYHRVKPRWVAGYSPHSQTGIGRPGALGLFPGRGYYIHEGNSSEDEPYGTLGCIEIIDGHWDGFLSRIEKDGQGTCVALAMHRKITVILEATGYPDALLGKHD